MTPTAHLSHRAPGRIRIRIPSRRHDPEFFETVHAGLRRLPGLRTITTNALTGSVLIEHSDAVAVDAVANFAVREKLFELAPEARPEVANETRPLTENVRLLCKDVDASLKKWSDGKLDLRSVTFVGLVGLGLYQMSQGKILPVAISLFDDARGILGD